MWQRSVFHGETNDSFIIDFTLHQSKMITWTGEIEQKSYGKHDGDYFWLFLPWVKGIQHRIHTITIATGSSTKE